MNTDQLNQPRMTPITRMGKELVNTRPHPSPLPQERGWRRVFSYPLKPDRAIADTGDLS